jgi:4a-hydroxytetrahydrobiopterin dehydratase
VTRRKLNDEEVQEALAQLSGWSLEEGRLHKEFKFRTFARALGWMVSVGVEADKLDHHPDWSNSYNKVKVNLITHDMGALSTLDIALAQKMDELA